MVTNYFGNRNFMQPMRRLREAQCFPFGGREGGGGNFFCIFLGLFPICSHEAPKVFPLGSQSVTQFANSQCVS
jgi:hypothetical protein